MTEAELITKLSRKYSPPDWGFISHVRNQTGYSNITDGIRTADGLAMGLWPSRGMNLIGFEIKTHRGDWITELKKPEKADAIARYCDYWYLVTDKGIVKPNELPMGWGLLEPLGGGLGEIVKAQKIDCLPMTRHFMAGMFRAINTGVVQKSEVQQMVRDEVAAKLKSKEWNAKYRVDECDKAEEKIKKLEGLIGEKVSNLWSGNIENLAAAIKIARAGKEAEILREFYRLKGMAEAIVKDIDERIKGNS